MNRKYLFIAIICGILFCPLVSAEDTTPPTIELVEPLPGSAIRTQLPNVKITYKDNESSIDTSSIQLFIDNLDVTEWEYITSITSTETIYETQSMFKLKNGNHTIKITVADTEGNTETKTWNFQVDTSLPSPEEESFDFFIIINFVIYGTIIVIAAICIYILYLKYTKNFTFEKFFAQHDINKEVFVLYIPLIIAFLIVLILLSYIQSIEEPIAYSIEFIAVIGIFIGLAPYGIESQIERRKISKYERSFAQLLFEIADAMRGGLDPTKAIIELAKTDTSILQKNLRIAADNIKLGRPFDEVMVALAKPIKSDLVQRYARLIGDTSKIGGEPAQIIHRAAKDMDDFIKVSDERRRQLLAQAMTVYVAFGVLIIVMYQLITMFPNLGSIDISLMGSSGLEEAGEAETSITRMSYFTLKQRFLDLLIINSLGTGSVIGSFVDGNIRYGLLHALALTIVSVVFFIVMIM